MHVVFKADGEETDDRFSEWWLEAGDPGPGPRCLNVFLPRGFEVMMPAIVDYFAEQNDAEEGL